ncbi:MBL fold hydrolase [Thioalkalivibrio denitrificans]|uniref:MBL fold hydrolase n=1 Tax=Thioalkalivibrio denitrificans TaxID=108003 RepID=A0A1V3NSU8_9GAMM|nr:MBL fold metallo-hydrolase [Thioalkalivibrio denitrificans]OOG28140.1 MBL fold hydrolase [Thioalkalivibrio denitrificans]
MSNPTPYSIHALELGPMENFIYLIHDHATDTAAVVDPAWEVPEINALAQRLGVRITDVLLTHSHHDHINGIDELLDTHDARIHLLKPEAQFWGRQLARPQLHHGGDRIRVGETEIEALHTPGHTPGSTCYRLGRDLITGDTLFVFGCGRCDLSGGDPEQMFQTLKGLREGLPEDTVIHPGHNYAEKPTSTLKEQAEGNPFMCFTEVDRFVHYRMHEHDRIRETPYRAIPCDHDH